jgi:hypothetical protein
MGRIKKGILGPFQGKVGTVVGSSWKGVDYMRSLPKTGRTSTAAQVEQQLKFGFTLRFVKSMLGLLRETYKDLAKEMSAFNNAVSYMLKHAITGTAPNIGISYANVLISRGELPNAVAPLAAATPTGGVEFRWTNNAGTGIAHADDKVVLLAYEPLTNSTVYSTNTAMRSNELATLNLAAFHGKTVHTYIGFMSANGKEVANSIYTGEVVVS